MVVSANNRKGTPARAARRPGPEHQEPTAAAELRIELRRDNRLGGDTAPAGRSRWSAWLQRLLPAAIGLRVTVPGTASVPMLRMLERVTFAIAWPTWVIGSLFGAAAAHLPPIGTIVVVVLELVIPAVMLHSYRERDVR